MAASKPKTFTYIAHPLSVADSYFVAILLSNIVLLATDAAFTVTTIILMRCTKELKTLDHT